MKRPETLTEYVDAILNADTRNLTAVIKNRPIEDTFKEISTHHVFEIVRSLANRPAETWGEKVTILYAIDELLAPHHKVKSEGKYVLHLASWKSIPSIGRRLTIDRKVEESEKPELKDNEVLTAYENPTKSKEIG